MNSARAGPCTLRRRWRRVTTHTASRIRPANRGCVLQRKCRASGTRCLVSVPTRPLPVPDKCLKSRLVPRKLRILVDSSIRASTQMSQSACPISGGRLRQCPKQRLQRAVRPGWPLLIVGLLAGALWLPGKTAATPKDPQAATLTAPAKPPPAKPPPAKPPPAKPPPAKPSSQTEPSAPGSCPEGDLIPRGRVTVQRSHGNVRAVYDGELMEEGKGYDKNKSVIFYEVNHGRLDVGLRRHHTSGTSSCRAMPGTTTWSRDRWTGANTAPCGKRRPTRRSDSGPATSSCRTRPRRATCACVATRATARSSSVSCGRTARSPSRSHRCSSSLPRRPGGAGSTVR